MSSPATELAPESPETAYKSRKDAAREVVYRAFVDHARRNPGLEQTLASGIGLFRFMDIVDLVVDELVTFQDQQTDLPAVAERLRAENAELRHALNEIAGITGRLQPAPAVDGPVLFEETPQ